MRPWSEQIGYFWLMVDAACQFIIRGDIPSAVHQLQLVHGVINDVERLLRQAPAVWKQIFIPPFEISGLDTQSLAGQIRAYCGQIIGMTPRINAAVGRPIQDPPMRVIDSLLALLE